MLKRHKKFLAQVPTGFSLMELVLSLVLIAVLALAVGYSLSSSRQSTSRIKSALAQVQQKEDLAHRISEQLRWATQIQELYPNYIKFDIPPADGVGQLQTVSYFWDNFTFELYYWNRTEMATSEVIHYGVPVFDIQYVEIQPGDFGEPHCQSLQIEIQLTQNSEDAVSKTIHLANLPEILIW